jgi:hypothetical protein
MEILISSPKFEACKCIQDHSLIRTVCKAPGQHVIIIQCLQTGSAEVTVGMCSIEVNSRTDRTVPGDSLCHHSYVAATNNSDYNKRKDAFSSPLIRRVPRTAFITRFEQGKSDRLTDARTNSGKVNFRVVCRLT